MRDVIRLAVPALGVLAAEPLYVLVDTAMVGHLGAVPLAALAVGGMVLTQASSMLTFFSYGTTARTARLHGAGRRADAVAEGAQATWLAIIVGVLLIGLGQLLASPVAHLLTGPDEVADAAVSWLRIALFGIPFILITMAGNGWMRGVQDTARPLRYVLAGNGISAVLCPVLVYGADLGLEGSAIANVAAQAISASFFLRALAVEGAIVAPDQAAMRAQLGTGRDLMLRSLAFLALTVSATSVAAHTTAAIIGAHQIVLQLWVFLALLLDSLAIAAQSLVGAALGAHDERAARDTARRVTEFGLIFGGALAVLFATLYWVLPKVFTSDPTVLAEVPKAWWLFVAMQPVCGVVFALDGVLFGAGDTASLRNITLISVGFGFLPVVWGSHFFGWGLTGIWAAIGSFMLVRLVLMVLRWRSGTWVVLGAELKRDRTHA